MQRVETAHQFFIQIIDGTLRTGILHDCLRQCREKVAIQSEPIILWLNDRSKQGVSEILWKIERGGRKSECLFPVCNCLLVDIPIGETICRLF